MQVAAVDGTILVADIAGFMGLTERLEARGRAGSELLTELINGVMDRVLAEVEPAGGVVLGFGGDAATVLVTGPGHHDRGLALAERMRDSLARAEDAGLSASIGVASGTVWLHAAAGELIPAGAAVTDALACQAAARPGEVRSRNGAAPAPDPAPADLPPALTALLPGPPATAAEHRRTAMGFVRLNWDPALPAPQRQDALDAALASLLESCERHDVSFLQSDVVPSGCKLLLAAGALRAADRAEERLAAVLTETVAAPPAGLVARAGMNRGAAFVADVGGGGVAGVTLMSDPVNVAARLAEAAEPGTVLATTRSADRLPGAFAAGEPSELRLRGRAEPVSVRVLSAPLATTAGRREPAPLIGREQELRRLRGAVARGERITLAGPAGIGKTRLLDELARTHAGPVLRIDGALYGRSAPYLAVREPLRELAGLDPSEAVREDIPAELRRGRLHGLVLARLRERLPAGALIVADDVQWLDDASRALLDAVGREAGRAGWAVVEARRAAPDGQEDVALGPLPPHATQALVDALVGSRGGAVLEPEKQRVASLAGGHPLICEELVAAACTPGRSAGAPESAEALLGERLDALGPADRRLVRELAVLGPRLDLDVAARLVAVAPSVLHARLRAADGLFAPDGDDALRFRHDLVREVAYEGLPFARRRDLHARALAILGERDAAPELLSAHAHAAGATPEAWRWSRIAGERALEAAAPLEALEFLQRADAAGSRLRAEPGARRRVLEQLADAQERVGALESAARTLGRARSLAGDDPVLRARLCFRAAELDERRGRYTPALRWITRARQALADAPDDAAAGIEVGLDRFAGALRLRQGRPAAALEHLLRAQAGAGALRLRAEQAETALLLSWAYAELGDPRAAEVRDVAAPIFAELGDDVGLAKALTNRGSDAYFDGEWDLACRHFEAAAEACRRVGDWTHLPYAWANIGEIRVRQGRLDEVRAPLEEAARLWTAAGYSFGIGMSNLYLGFGEMYAGALDAARDRFAAAEAALRAGGSGSLAEVHAAWVELHARRGDAAAARAALAFLGAPARDEGPIEAARRELAAAHAALAAGDATGAAAAAARAAATARGAQLPYEELCAIGLCGADPSRAAALRERLGVVRELAIAAGPRS